VRVLDSRNSHQHWAMMLCIALASWPPAAWAVDVTAGADLFGLPWAQIGASGVICVWGAMARTNQRARAANEVDERFEVWKELWRDIRRSSVIGAVVYLTGATQGWSAWQLGGALLLAGYSGPAALDLWSAKFKAPS
jgi:hypothetical protein